MFELCYTYKLPRGGIATIGDCISKCCNDMVKQYDYEVYSNTTYDYSMLLNDKDTFKIIVISKKAGYIQCITIDVIGRREHPLSEYI